LSQENDLVLKGEIYKHFINGIKSSATQLGYKRSLRRYLTFLKLKEVDDLLPHNPSPRYIESQIISYIMSLRETGIAYATIQFLIAPIFTFYQLNDVVLNRKKVSRYMGEYKRVAKDGVYTTENIQQALQNADARMRMIILLLASTGCRVGALPSLTLGNLTIIPDYGLYRITFYEGTNNEMYTFTTRETAQTGIDNYLLYRKRMGESILFNEKTQKWEPEDVSLIRKQYDVNDLLQVKQPKPMELNAIRHLLTVHLIRCGLRTREHPTAPQSNGKIRKSVSLSKGFRKRCISLFIEAGLNHEIRELIVDHATQLDQNYFRPTEDQVLQEYLKAEPYLTIDSSARLAQENQALKQEVNRFDKMEKQIEELNRKLGLA
jgi:site-specific recombinase XerD